MEFGRRPAGRFSYEFAVVRTEKQSACEFRR
jgi:hypothetical protein